MSDDAHSMDGTEPTGPYKGKGETVDVVDDRVDRSDSEPSEVDSDEPMYRDKQWLYHQYHVLKKSQGEISRSFDVHRTTIGAWLDKHGIEKREHGDLVSRSMRADSPWRDKDWLHTQYVELGKSTTTIAEEYGACDSNIGDWLDKHGIDRTAGHHSDQFYEGKVHTNREWLHENYIENGKSTYELAEMADVSVGTIQYWLEKHDIETRSREESTQLHYARENVVPLSDKIDKSADGDGSGTTITSGNSSYTGPSDGIDVSWSDMANRGTKPVPAPYRDEGWLYEMHHTRGLTGPEIADLCDVSSTCIYDWMDRHGIERNGGRKQDTGTEQ